MSALLNVAELPVAQPLEQDGERCAGEPRGEHGAARFVDREIGLAVHEEVVARTARSALGKLGS